MKAYQLYEDGKFALEEVKDPQPAKDEAIIKVKKAGICGSDIPRIFNGKAHKYPLIPGHEFAGIVTEVGNNANHEWLGKRVGIYPLIPCGHCIPCSKGKYEMCLQYSYLGSRRNGGFAEYVAVPVRNLRALPEYVQWEDAALLEPLSVAIHAVRRWRENDKEGKTAAVCGLGTIGQMVIMVLKTMGVKHIIVLGNKQVQKDAAISSGVLAEDYLDSRTNDGGSRWIKEKTNGRGTDIFFECTGKSASYSLAIESAAPGSQIVLVGNPASDMVLRECTYGEILRRQLTISGTWNSTFVHEAWDDWHYALTLLEKWKTLPSHIITHRFSMEKLLEGFLLMKGKKEEYIKVMGEFS